MKKVWSWKRKRIPETCFFDAEQCEGMRKTLEKLRFEAPKIMAYNP